jgi:ribosomal protein L37AE/L43A
MEITMSPAMRRERRKATRCWKTGKVGYRTAKKARRFAERGTQMQGQMLTVYECPFCDRYHLTKQAPRQKS